MSSTFKSLLGMLLVLGVTIMSTFAFTTPAYAATPVTRDDSAVGDEDTASVIIDVLRNDSDPAGGTLTITHVEAPYNGDVEVIDEKIVFYPHANVNGVVEFSYIASNAAGEGSWANVTVFLRSSPDAPRTSDQEYFLAEDTTKKYDTYNYGWDPDGYGYTRVTSITQPQNGIANLDDFGHLTYTPNKDFTGRDYLTFTVCDTDDMCTNGRVTFTVTNINDAPVAIHDAVSTEEDTAVTISPLLNDTDVDGDRLMLQSVATPEKGSVTISSSQREVTYTPAPGFNGTVHFNYYIVDSENVSGTGTIEVTVTSTNDAPTAGADVVEVIEDTTKQFNVGTNDFDEDNADETLITELVTQPAHGTVVQEENGADFTYTPTRNYFGVDTFTYKLTDTTGAATTGVVTLNVRGVNDAPVAGEDTVTATEDMAAALDLDGNDRDVEDHTDLLTVNVATQPLHGKVFKDAETDQLVYVPDTNYAGVDTFTYRLTDTGGLTDTAKVTINVTNANDAPVGVDDAATTRVNTRIVINALSNDRDVDGDTLRISTVEQPARGTVTVDTAGRLVYTPAAGWVGLESFNYRVKDSSGAVDNTVTVRARTVALNAVADSFTVKPSVKTVNFNVLGNDVKPGSTFKLKIVKAPVRGTVKLNALTGEVTYTVTKPRGINDTFTYQLCHNTYNVCDTAAVSVKLPR